MNNQVYAPADQDDYLLEKKDKIIVMSKPTYGVLYVITHFIISFFAIYLSWRCNKGFNLLSFICALFCPYLYIIWALATQGGCGILDNVQN
jgi:hypothetical protein